IDFSDKINRLLNNTELWQTLSKKARERAVLFTWDKTARRIVQLFEELHRKKKLINPNRLLNVFTPAQPSEEEHPEPTYKSFVLSMNEHYERCLIRDAVYPLRVENGLVLSILKEHTRMGARRNRSKSDSQKGSRLSRWNCMRSTKWYLTGVTA
ncbi:glycosyltransferase, partial [Candidatus Poribacteria bacterium]|nr:glycosyltransferase [Candidatus Poribacteria bacterium]